MAKRGSVLVVDDEEIMRDVLETLLSAEGYRVDLAKTGEEGLECYGRRAYDVVLLDVSMPGMGGLRALEEILKADPEAVVVIITAYATFDTAIGAWERGAFNCVRKPFQNEQIIATVAAGIKRRRKEEERQSLRRAMSRSVERGQIVGRSEKMQAVFSLVDQVAPARSITFSSSRTLPGQVYCSSSASTSGESWSEMSRLFSSSYLRTKCCASGRMSSRRSRRGGSSIGTTARR